MNGRGNWRVLFWMMAAGFAINAVWQFFATH